MYDPDNPPNPIFQLFGTIACVIIGVPFLLTLHVLNYLKKDEYYSCKYCEYNACNCKLRGKKPKRVLSKGGCST